MGAMAGLALAGSAFQTLGALAAQQEKKSLARLRKYELDVQAKTSQELFDFNFRELKVRQKAQLGNLAAENAKKGVAGESGSVLSQLSEQARINSLNKNLANFQNNLEQRSFRVDQFLNKRTIQNIKNEQVTTAIAGVVGGTSSFIGAGGLS